MSNTKKTGSRPEFLVALVRWFDTSAGVEEGVVPGEQKMDLVRVIPFLAMHLACLAVILVGWSWTAVGVAAGFYLVRMFAVTAFYHRYFSHRTFKTSRGGQLAFALLGATAVQRGPLWWAAHHRHHHRHSDQEEDLHSPSRHGLFWSHMGWITSKANFPTNFKAVPDLAKFPELMFLDRFDVLVPAIVAFLLYGTGALLERFAPALGTSGMQMLVWGFFISTVVLFHASCTINSLAHRLGRRRYATGDESRNSFLLAFLTLGEGWHNNHHHYPASTAQGFFWWEIDVTYGLLKLLSWTGLVWDLQKVPPQVRMARIGSPASS